jgi:hypothetical protein
MCQSNYRMWFIPFTVFRNVTPWTTLPSVEQKRELPSSVKARDYRIPPQTAPECKRRINQKKWWQCPHVWNLALLSVAVVDKSYINGYVTEEWFPSLPPCTTCCLHQTKFHILGAIRQQLLKWDMQREMYLHKRIDQWHIYARRVKPLQFFVVVSKPVFRRSLLPIIKYK